METTAKQSSPDEEVLASTREIERAIQPDCRIGARKRNSKRLVKLTLTIEFISLLCRLTFEEVADCLRTDSQQLGCLGLIVAGQFHGLLNKAASGL